MELNEALGLVMRDIRQSRRLPQEGLGPSQSYISALERGKWKASLDKVEQIAEILSLHPMTLLLLAYQRRDPSLDASALIAQIQAELDAHQRNRAD
ncbi:helix-turn-helix domain-containing protein [Aquipseudomonas alcaligenes]|uniref:helix-turn-helix domain-containing protein n=1 Tax=Aquipseudomonas alcaligenes TaxID=43263 RepID=UPI0009706158|nr:helix-turn-helix transcriptional regulator [Pseudomonas alcaligenes]